MTSASSPKKFAATDQSVVELKPSFNITIVLVAAGVAIALFLQIWVGAIIGVFGLFLAFQTTTLRLQFTATDLDIYRSGDRAKPPCNGLGENILPWGKVLEEGKGFRSILSLKERRSPQVFKHKKDQKKVPLNKRDLRGSCIFDFSLISRYQHDPSPNQQPTCRKQEKVAHSPDISRRSLKDYAENTYPETQFAE
ncbi:hypothetical protein NIES208_01030 [[Limnothrix rosea] IAM M-220]|nr:hypothetical protein NIES208_01030 [[Limnothrix rosea] IAM M-220]